MKFLIDRCAGLRLASWLADNQHDVRTAWEKEPDPGDTALLRLAVEEGRILVTIDCDFGTLVYLLSAAHAALSGCRTYPPPNALRWWPICWTGMGRNSQGRS